MSRAATTVVREGFISHGWPKPLVDEVLASFAEAKRRFHRRDLRPQAVEGGRFSEGVMRLMQFEATGIHEPLDSRNFNVGRAITQLENTVSATDAVRFHIPRAVRLIYDIRNNRDTGHLRDGIDPNLQDATLVVTCMDWILAEMVRIAHNVSADEAQKIIANLVTKEVPLIEEFEGRPVVSKDLPRKEHVLVILYWAGSEATRSDLRKWLPANVAKYLAQFLADLEKDHLVHTTGENVYLTRRGIQSVEEHEMLGPS